MTNDEFPPVESPVDNPHGIDEPVIGLDDTQPNPVYARESGIPAPPRFLLIAVIGLFMLALIGLLSGIVLFREALSQGQQQRVINMFPFMEAFQERAPTPEGGILQRADEADTDAASDLLNLDLGEPTGQTEAPAVEVAPEETPEITPEATEETDTEASIALPTATIMPTNAPTQTPQPTSTPEPETNANNSGDDVTTNAASQNTTSAADSPAQTVLTSAQTWATTAYNGGFNYYKQTWNNCGPANVSMALSYYGWQRPMEYAADRIKPNSDDKNVSPSEMVNFVETESDVNALWRMGGDLDLLRTLIHNEFPVLIERGQRFEGTDWLGHYQTLVGYDDNLRQFLVYDSFLGNADGNGRAFDYSEVDHHWREFNRIFIVVYEPAREARLMELLGDYATLEGSAEIAFNTAQEEARTNPQDPHAWFNMGSSLVGMQQYEAAGRAFDRAFDIGVPWRILWYQFGPYEAYFENGRYQDILDLVNANLQNGGDKVEETYYWQGRVLAELGRIPEARTAFNRALGRNRLFEPARQALDSL